MKITKEEALMLYPKTEDWFKEILEKEFGRDIFIGSDFRNLKTFAVCCMVCGTTEEEFENKWRNVLIDFQSLAFERMKIINRAINQEWEPDYFNTDQYKWAPWFKVSSSGLVFTYSGYDYVSTYAGVGFRLCFETEEKANHAGLYFTKYFQEFITGKKA